MSQWLLDRRAVLKGLVPWVAGGAVLLAPNNSSIIRWPVSSVQSALIHLGYLPQSSANGVMDDETQRALIRFKRHARRTYRVSKNGEPQDVPQSDCFPGECDLMLTEATGFQLKTWVERGWRLPLGRFHFEPLAKERTAPFHMRWAILREDITARWRDLMTEVRARGGTLEGPYGDTFRPLGFPKKDGVSAVSFHISGRAIDLNQSLGHSRKQRYFLVPEPKNDHMYWRILCRTDQQNGSQGKYYRAGAEPCWSWVANSDSPLPEGHYLDLTRVLEEEGLFERIPARRGYQKNYVRTEWWHYQYAVGKQETFLDEVELVGISKQQLMRAGYGQDDMDRRPG